MEPVARYKKFVGWNGTVYWVRMSKEEVEARRILGLLIGLFTVTPLMIVVMAFAAGLFG